MTSIEYLRLPKIFYDYSDLSPYISEEQLKLHHQKHHKKYTQESNNILNSLNDIRKNNKKGDPKSISEDLSFNLSGHILHTLFWTNLRPPRNNSNVPTGRISNLINEEFVSFEKFKSEVIKSSLRIQGSGWVALSYSQSAKKTVILCVEKHNNLLIPEYPILLVLDVWEHAYYLDYKNDRESYLENLWPIVNWDEVEKRFGVIPS